MRDLALLLVGAAALGLPLVSAQGAPQATGKPLVLQGKCASGGGSAACTSCAVALAQEIKQPAGDRALIGSCPKMAAGRYRLSIAVPVQLLPAQPATKTFAQLKASLGATAQDRSGRTGGALAGLPAVTWSWFGPAGYVLIHQSTPVTIDRDGGVDIDVKLRDLRYFIPHQTQGPAHHDGELVVGKAELMSLERIPTPTPTQLGVPQEFSAKTLAKVVPGRTTQKEVAALLGKPWRTDEGDEDENVPPSWNYRGKDANGIYLLHIQFDDRGTAALVVKVREKTNGATRPTANTRASSAKP